MSHSLPGISDASQKAGRSGNLSSFAAYKISRFIWRGVFKEKGEGEGVKEKEVGSAGGFGSGSKLGDDASSKLEVENDVGTMVGQTPAGNTLGMSSYANVTSAPSRKALNFCTLLTLACNGFDVRLSVVSIRAISERFANTAYGSFWESGWLTLLLLTMLGTLRDGLSAIATKLGTPLMLDSIYN
ncbi:hypothetical protein Tco_0551784 [Tanacetum coccineum]